jgi:hypothetical protein
MGKERKGKRKGFLSLNGPGGFRPSRARAAARAAGSARPANRARREDDAVGAGPHASEGEGNDVRGETAVRPRWGGTGRRRSRRRFFAGDPVLGGRGGGIAQAGVGGHGGGVNLAGGGSGRPVHSEVAGSRGVEVTGEAYKA